MILCRFGHLATIKAWKDNFTVFCSHTSTSGSVPLFCPFQIGYVWRPVGQLINGLLFFPVGMSVGTNLSWYGEENSSQDASLLYANWSYLIGPSPFALSLSPQPICLLLYPILCFPYINPVPSALLELFSLMVLQQKLNKLFCGIPYRDPVPFFSVTWSGFTEELKSLTWECRRACVTRMSFSGSFSGKVTALQPTSALLQQLCIMHLFQLLSAGGMTDISIKCVIKGIIYYVIVSYASLFGSYINLSFLD